MEWLVFIGLAVSGLVAWSIFRLVKETEEKPEEPTSVEWANRTLYDQYGNPPFNFRNNVPQQVPQVSNGNGSSFVEGALAGALVSNLLSSHSNNNSYNNGSDNDSDSDDGFVGGGGSSGGGGASGSWDDDDSSSSDDSSCDDSYDSDSSDSGSCGSDD